MPEPRGRNDSLPGAPDYQTLWCRGGGKSAATTDVEWLTFANSGSHGTAITVEFDFVGSQVAAGADGAALAPGACAYADRGYPDAAVHLKFEDTSRGHVRWRTTAAGTSPPQLSVTADGVRSDKWFMKAQVTKASHIGSYEAYTR